MADKYVLLLEFTSGIIEPLPLSTETLTQDRIVIAIDELKERVWLWQGSQTSMVEQRAAQRKGRSLVSAGYQFGHLKIGRDVDRIEIIDGDLIDDPEVKEHYNQLIHTLNQSFQIKDQVLGSFSGSLTPLPAPSEAPPPPAPKAPSPAQTSPPQTPVPKPASPTKPTATAETVAPMSPRELHDLGVIRVGVLISTLLDFFPMIYTTTKKQEDTTRFTIEDPEGTIAEIDVSEGSVHFLKRYDFRGKRKEVLSLLRDRLAAAEL